MLLQNRVARLEDFILELQNVSSSERDSKLHAFNLSTTLRRTMSSPMAAKSGSTFYHTSNMHVTSSGSLSFHGPSSIYHVFPGNEERFNTSNQHSDMQEKGFKSTEHVLEHFNIDIKADIITQTLLLFFKWQYPNHVFIYRDAFLRDHYGARRESKYWSTSLLLSLCALGSLMLPETDRGDFGERCREAAVSIAIVADLMHPSVTALQTFLCLAFCEIGLGNLSKGWAFSGRVQSLRSG